MKVKLTGHGLTNQLLAAALKYRQLGFSVIPLRGPKYAIGETEEKRYDSTKRPLIKWEGHQKQKATEDDIKSWFQKWPEANLGLVTGKISGLAVIDLDEPEKAKQVLNELVPDSLPFPISQTPSGGEHWYFHCEDSRIRNNTRIVPGADLRAEGGYVVARPQ
jgi:hypothetical protein